MSHASISRFCNCGPNGCVKAQETTLNCFVQLLQVMWKPPPPYHIHVRMVASLIVRFQP